MKSSLTCVVLFVLAMSCAGAATADAAEIYDQKVNLVYGEAHGVGLVMDIFVPTGKKNGLGIVDVISGAWYSDRGKLRDHQRAQIFDIFCRKGYTIFAIRPGSITKFTVPEMLDNLRRGIRWVKEHADDYNVAADRLGLIGASAGGHLACLAAVTANEKESASVRAAGIFFPPTDFLEYAGQKPDVRAEFGLGAILRRLAFPKGVDGLSDEEITRRVTQISPARLVTKHSPPFLLFHGSADFTVPLRQSKVMVEALKKAGISAELIVKKGGGHPWPTIHEEVLVLANWFDKQLTSTQPAGQVTIDGKFSDWAGIRSYTDPARDTHDTEHKAKSDKPDYVDHPDVDLLEYKVTHDAKNLYFYLRARGRIGRTQKAAGAKRAGRYYIAVTIDVDQNDETGYWLHEGGYYPTSRGYDVNAEVEFYDGQFNTGHYLNHGAKNEAELKQAFLDQSSSKYVEGNDGPYQPGFMRVLPGTYKNYTQWVYHKNGTITFVRDKGPVVLGIVSAMISADGHQLEMSVPMKGFLNDDKSRPIVALGRKLDISFSLEASGELASGGRWASDTGEPVEGYLLKTPNQK